MRVPQKEGKRGSLKWMQRLAAAMPHSVGSRLKALLGLAESDHIDWLSPAPGDRAEFRDREFLKQIGREDLAERLSAFWPARGPQWDGIATCGQKVILVEAKARANEMKSSCAAGKPSLERIQAALHEAQRRLGADPSRDWTKNYYQYANRLAHLDFLRANGVDAHLVFIYFYNADMDGPTSPGEWHPAIEQALNTLGLAPNRIEGVHDLFVDAAELA